MLLGGLLQLHLTLVSLEMQLQFLTKHIIFSSRIALREEEGWIRVRDGKRIVNCGNRDYILSVRDSGGVGFLIDGFLFSSV